MNPNQLINSMLKNNPALRNNPMIGNAMQMAQNGNIQGLQELANNIAKEKGIDINTFKQQLETNMRI